MSTARIAITSGPDKADLLRAATSPDDLHAAFGTPHGMVEAHINALQEVGSHGMDFTVWGYLTSTNLSGAVFTGFYNCESRTGRLALKTVGD